MTENNNSNLDSWDDYLGNWLKPENVPTVPATAIVIGIRSDKDPQDENQVVLTLNYASKKWDFSLNKTNMKFIKETVKLMPKQLKDKKLTFTKIKVRNPSTKTMVDSLLIEKVE